MGLYLTLQILAGDVLVLSTVSISRVPICLSSDSDCYEVKASA